MAILIIEDEEKLADILRRALKSERFATDSAYDGETGFEKALTGNYDLIILDIMLPKKDGLEICRDLRAKNVFTPIIMLTARGTVEDRISGLDFGADDYLVKPFSIDELMARIRTVLRRRKTVDGMVWKIADLILDTKKHELKRDGKTIPLTLKEHRILSLLMSKNGEAISRRELLDDAWGPEFNETNHELNVHMRYLRRKVDDGRKKPLIQTIRGVGYTLKE